MRPGPDFDFYADISEAQLGEYIADIEKIGRSPRTHSGTSGTSFVRLREIAFIVKEDIHFAVNGLGLVGLKQTERK